MEPKTEYCICRICQDFKYSSSADGFLPPRRTKLQKNVHFCQFSLVHLNFTESLSAEVGHFNTGEAFPCTLVFSYKCQ